MRSVPKSLLEPWLITAEGLHRVVDVWSMARAGGESFGTLQQARAEWKARPKLEEPGDPVEGTGDTLRIVDGVGVLTLRGTIFRHASVMEDISGGVSCDSLWRGMEAAIDDPSVRSILLKVDSPGGEANGIGELADYFLAARSVKPFHAYVEGMGCSAAYWLLSQADQVTAHRTAMIGSIGVRVELVDESKAEERAGLRMIEMVSASAPDKRNKPVDDEVLARVQTKIDDLEAEFVEGIAHARGIDAKKVYADFGQGDYMIAGKALDAGMIDEIGDFNGALDALRERANSPAPLRRKGSAMPKPRAEADDDKDEKKPFSKKAKAEDTDDEKKARADAEGEEDAEADEEPAMEMVECAHCEGSGKMPDGSMCESCGGTGKVSQEAETETEDEADADADNNPINAEAEDADADGDGEPDGDEKKARASLAVLAGMKPGARLSRIAAVLKAKTAPLSALARVSTENETLRRRLDALESDKHRAAARAFVTKAIADGRTVEDKRKHLEGEYASAERRKPGTGAKALEPQLFARGSFTVGRRYTTHGNPTGREVAVATFAQDSPVDIRAAFAAKVDEILKSDPKIEYRDATARVQAMAPDLYAAYRAFGRVS